MATVKVNVVDYIGSLGGGVRFTLELLRGLRDLQPEAEFRLISHGRALERYEGLLGAYGLKVPAWDIAPSGQALNRRHPQILRTAIGPLLKRAVRGIVKWHYDVPRQASTDCDVVWLPWCHWHRLPQEVGLHAVASFHDTIELDVPGLVPDAAVADELMTARKWIGSEARVVVSSNATASRLKELTGCAEGRCLVVRLAADHARRHASREGPSRPEWPSFPYLLYAANTSPHKNHEVLLRGFSLWGAKWPLVLVGEHTRLDTPGRGAELGRLAASLGLKRDTNLVCLGYVPDEDYATLLYRAGAVVIASRAEGGGSFPAWEALICGIPVVCSDIPVMREQLEWLGAQVMWFDPSSPEGLARCLATLESHYAVHKAQAERQVAVLKKRTWTDVARDYWEIFTTFPGEKRNLLEE